MPIVSSNREGVQVVHVAGPRPTPRQLAREVRDVTVAAPWFAIAPLVRHWPRRWHRPANALMSLVLFEIGDFPMTRKMLRTLKQRAETGSRAED